MKSEQIENQPNVFNAELITASNTIRNEVNKNSHTEGYLCTSETSSLKSEIYVDPINEETIAYIIGKDDEVVHMLKFQVDFYEADNKICMFTVYNEFDEPIISGIFDTIHRLSQITQIYNNDTPTRASVAAWGCTLSLGIVGGIWSTAAGMVSAGAGFAVGMAYTVMAMGFCGDL